MYPGNISGSGVGGKKADPGNANKVYYPPNAGIVEYTRGIPAGAVPHQLAPKTETMLQPGDPAHAGYLGQLQLMHLQQAAPMEFLAYNNQLGGYANPAMMKKQGLTNVPLVQSTSTHIGNAEQATERSLHRTRARKPRGKKRKPSATKTANRKNAESPQTNKRAKKDAGEKWKEAEDDANVDEETRRERKNEREKQRRQEISTQFQNLVDILDIPKNSGADKVTILAKAVETIKALKNALIATNAAKAGYYIPRDPRQM